MNTIQMLIIGLYIIPAVIGIVLGLWFRKYKSFEPRVSISTVVIAAILPILNIFLGLLLVASFLNRKY
jgi:hypothetical protein